jgi:rSAM/selenodomain-associated transferase 1
MAKTPRPGHVKTRLIPPLTAEEATALNAAFLRDVTATIAAVGRELPVKGFVAYAPAGGEALFDGVLAPDTGLVLADGSVPLGEDVSGIGRSLVHATRSLTARGFDAVCLVNSDSPTLPGTILADAVRALGDGRRVVLGPAEDGGYYLIGIPATLATAAEALFRHIPWSTAGVTAATLDRAAEVPLEVLCLPRWYDVDDPPSLRRLVGELTAADGPAAGAAPETRACVAHLGLARRLSAPGR